jgi:hypothetical protein
MKGDPLGSVDQGPVLVGIQTDRYEDMKYFCHNVLGLVLDHEEPNFVAFKLPDGSIVEVFGPSDEDHAYFATGLLPVSRSTMSKLPAPDSREQAWSSSGRSIARSLRIESGPISERPTETFMS